MIRILLAEDQAMMGGALAVLLGLEPDLDVVSVVTDGAQILSMAVHHRPDVALLDIELPNVSGIEAAEQLGTLLPECLVIMVTTFARTGYLQRALEAGARGFVTKDGPAEGLADAIRTVVAGGTVIDPALARTAIRARRNPLTSRERDVLLAAVDGASVAGIAAGLHLAPATVRNYLSDAIGKTGTRNRIEAVAVARREGWL